MAAIDYPANLPGVLISQNVYRPQSRVKRNDLSSGPPLFVLQDDDGWVGFDVAWKFTGEQMENFRDWFRNTLISGSKLFNIDLFVDDTTATHECFFDSPAYKARQRGKIWFVSARLIAIHEVGV